VIVKGWGPALQRGSWNGQRGANTQPVPGSAVVGIWPAMAAKRVSRDAAVSGGREANNPLL
jgi:hypothetical protein